MGVFDCSNLKVDFVEGCAVKIVVFDHIISFVHCCSCFVCSNDHTPPIFLMQRKFYLVK